MRNIGIPLVLLAFAAPLANAQPLTDRLPASTIVYVGWSPSAQLQTTMMAKMLADERITAPLQRMFQEVLLSMRNAEGAGERISDHIPALLETASHCEGCFAVLELTQGKKRLKSESLFMLDLGAKRQVFEKHFAPIQASIKERFGDRLQMIKLEKSWVYYKADRDGKPQITWGVIADTFVMYFGEGAHEFVPKLVKGQLQPNLKTSPNFADTVGKIPGESIFTTYLDTRAALGLARRLMEREGSSDVQILVKNWDKLLQELGADNVKGLAEKTVVQDNQFVTRSLLRTEGAARGLLALAAQPAVDDAMMKAIPADAMAACAARLDLAKFYDQIKSAATNVVGEPAKEAFKELEEGAAGMKIPLNQTFAALGDQWVVYNAPSTGGFALTGWTLVCNIRDKEAFNRLLNTMRIAIIAAAGREGIREIRDGDLKIEYVRGQGFSMPFAPAWAIVGDKLIVAMYPQHVEDAARLIAGQGKSLLENLDYVAARQRTGNTGAMVYLSGPEVIRSVYPVGLILAGMIDAFSHYSSDEPRVWAIDLVPSLQRLLQYVGTSAMSIKSTPDGILKTRSVGNPLLSPMAWVDSPAVWLAVGIPALGYASEADDRVKSANNLRQIGMGMMLYANENKGAFPPDLQALTKTQDLSADVLTSPYGPAKQGPDIVYLHFAGIGQKTAGADVIVAYDKAALDTGEGTNALYGDGRVEWLDPAGFQKALEQSKKKAQLNAAQP